MATHSSILAWEIHGQRSLVGYSPWGHQKSDMTERPSLSSLTCGKCTYCKYTSTIVLCMPVCAPSILSSSIFQHPLEHPSSGFWEECGSLGLKPALFILGVSQPFLRTTPLASGFNYPPHWLKTGFLNLRGKVSAAAFPSFKLIHSSLSVSSLSPEHCCSKIYALPSGKSSQTS